MRATWSTKTGRLSVVGTHPGGIPRRWLVSVWAQLPNDERVTWQFRPRQPVLLTDLADLIEQEMAKHPNKTAAGWTALAR